MGNSFEATIDNFDAEVMESPMPVIVDFWAPWCGPCKMLSPVLEEIADAYAGKIKVVKVNTDEQQELAVRFAILNIPCLKIFQDGRIVAEQVGFTSKQNLEKLIKPLIGE